MGAKTLFPLMDGCFGVLSEHILATLPLSLSLSLSLSLKLWVFRASVLSLAQPLALCFTCQSQRRSHPREFYVSGTLEASLAGAVPNQTPPDALSVSIM